MRTEKVLFPSIFIQRTQAGHKASFLTFTFIVSSLIPDAFISENKDNGRETNLLAGTAHRDGFILLVLPLLLMYAAL